MAAGWPSREELVETYARARGMDVEDHPFWHALGLWKVAIIAEGVRRRVLDEPRNEAQAGAPTTEAVDAFVARGHDALGAWLS